MSRSRKKHPYMTDGPNKWAKRQASKRVRRKDVSDGANYKKVYCSYDICDFKFRWEEGGYKAYVK